MTLAPFLTFVVVIGALYAIFKLVINPLIKLVLGLLTLFIGLSIVKTVLHISFNDMLGTYRFGYDIDAWISGFDWISQMAIDRVNQLIELIKSFLNKN